jgi:hypothetical protein
LAAFFFSRIARNAATFGSSAGFLGGFGMPSK